MKKIYVVSSFSMEPYSDYGDYPSKAFFAKEAAERFIANNDGVYDEGFFRWDKETETDVPCDENHPDAIYEYGWRYSSYISEIELVEE